MKTRIAGMGLYAPGEPIGNGELKRLTGIDFNEQKIEEKIGIRERHIAKLRGIEETTADFAEKAAREAIKNAGITPDKIGLFIVATDTPEYITPGTAIIVQGRLQKSEKPVLSFDVSASCAGFVTALDTGMRIIGTNPEIDYGVVAGVYNMPAYVRDGDSFGYSIFADGAAAAVITKDRGGKSEYLNGSFVTDGTQWDFIGVYAGGTKKPVTHKRLDSGDFGLQLLQRLPGDRNINLWPPLAKRLTEAAGKSIEDLDHILFTQINKSVIMTVMELLGLPAEKTTTIMDRYGYTGSACIPMAFYHALQDGKVKRGDLVAFIASGAGFAVGSNLFIY